MKHHGWDAEYLDNMCPWEKQVYIVMLMQWLEAERQRLEEEARRR